MKKPWRLASIFFLLFGLVAGTFAYEATRPDEVKKRSDSGRRVKRIRAIQTKNVASIEGLKALAGYTKPNPTPAELRELLHKVVDVMLENSTNGVASVVRDANVRRPGPRPRRR